jgi:Domain of unknown function (4846)
MRGWLAVLFGLAIVAPGGAAAEPVYPWLDHAPAETIVDRFAAPQRFVRVAAKPGSLGEWLRGLPLMPAGTPVRLHDGREKVDQSGAAAVIDIDIGGADLQQCADAIIRLRAEYLFSRGAFADIAFDFTSGDRYRFESYATGIMPVVSGNKVSWRRARGNDGSHASMRRWLDIVFTYAGTMSLSRELKQVESLSNAEIGDALILPGSPGHAVLIVDMATHAATGRKAVLLAQGFMPAQSVHILANAADPDLSPWFVVGADRVDAPPWRFTPDRLRRFH